MIRILVFLMLVREQIREDAKKVVELMYVVQRRIAKIFKEKKLYSQSIYKIPKTF
jgi:hypothetical protein